MNAEAIIEDLNIEDLRELYSEIEFQTSKQHVRNDSATLDLLEHMIRTVNSSSMQIPMPVEHVRQLVETEILFRFKENKFEIYTYLFKFI